MDAEPHVPGLLLSVRTLVPSYIRTQLLTEAVQPREGELVVECAVSQVRVVRASR